MSYAGVGSCYSFDFVLWILIWNLANSPVVCLKPKF